MEGLRNFGGGIEHPKPPLGTPLPLRPLYASWLAQNNSNFNCLHPLTFSKTDGASQPETDLLLSKVKVVPLHVLTAYGGVGVVPLVLNLIIIIIFIYCNWVVTQWQWLFYMYTKLEIGYY